MAIDENKILYKIKKGKFFEFSKKTTEWAEAKNILKDTIANSKNSIAFLEVYYDGALVGIFNVTDPALIKKPRLELGLTYDEIVKKAIDTNTCAFSINSVTAFFWDEKQAKSSGDIRKVGKVRLRSGDILFSAGYVNDDISKKR